MVREPSKEWIEDLILEWDLLDMKARKGKFTWTNKRLGPGHIAARMDRFLIQSSFILMGLDGKSDNPPFLSFRS